VIFRTPPGGGRLGGVRRTKGSNRTSGRGINVADCRPDGKLVSLPAGTSSLPGTRAPAGIDTSTAHIARVYNYWLGGKDNFAPDRAAAQEVIAAYPAILASVRAQRAFLGRAVRYLAAEAGVTQFLDIGTGLPSADNTHEVAQRVTPQARIVYVDNDPSVLVHARALLASSRQGMTAYVEADLREVAPILRAAAGTLDFTRPVGLLLVGVLHCIPDRQDPGRIVARLLDALAPGSYLVLAHPASDIHTSQIGQATSRFNRLADQGVTLRGRGAVAAFLDGLDLVDPGLVQLHRWRPGPGGPEPGHDLANYGAVGRKP
jgi:SAM-dependent methyltransferase